MAQLNTDEIQPTGRLIPRIRRVRIRIGRPAGLLPVRRTARRPPVERAVTDEIMYELMELSGREYVDVYAQSLKTAPPAPPTPVVSASAGLTG